MVFELFIFGGFFFWSLILVEVVFLGAAIWNEKGWPASISLVVLAFLLMLFGDFNVFMFVWENIGVLWEYVVGYAVIGASWAVFKWFLFNSDVKSTLKGAKETFMESNKIEGGKIPDENMEAWQRHLENVSWPRGHLRDKQYTSSITTLADIRPKIRHYKADAIYWISYWPISVLWAVLHDAIERIARWTYDAVKGIFEAVSRMVWKGMPEDLK